MRSLRAIGRSELEAFPCAFLEMRREPYHSHVFISAVSDPYWLLLSGHLEQSRSRRAAGLLLLRQKQIQLGDTITGATEKKSFGMS